jgi:hypothetical protein
MKNDIHDFVNNLGKAPTWPSPQLIKGTMRILGINQARAVKELNTMRSLGEKQGQDITQAPDAGLLRTIQSTASNLKKGSIVRPPPGFFSPENGQKIDNLRNSAQKGNTNVQSALANAANSQKINK